MSSDQAQRILRLNKVLDRTGLSRSTLYRNIERRHFQGRCEFPRDASGGAKAMWKVGFEIRCTTSKAIEAASSNLVLPPAPTVLSVSATT